MRYQLFLEVLRNLKCNKLQTFLTVAVSLAIGLGITLFSSYETANIVDRNRKLENNGLNVWQVLSDTGFAAHSCEELSELDGIIASGSRMRQISVTSTQLPGSAINTVTVTPGYVGVVWPDAYGKNSFSTAIGNELTVQLGLRAASTLTLRSAKKEFDVFLEKRLQPSTRVVDADQVLVFTAPPKGKVTECLVETLPTTRSAVENLLLSALTANATVSPLLSAEVSKHSFSQPVGSRVSVWASLILGIFTVCVVSLMQFVRRTEWSLYRILGVTSKTCIKMITLEFAFACWLPFSLGSLSAIFINYNFFATEIIVAISVTNDYMRSLLILLLGPLFNIIILEAGNGPIHWLKGA